MADPEPPPKNGDSTGKKLDHIIVYSDDKREMDRLFGESTSYAKRQKAILTVIKRERLVEKVRRQVLGGIEELEGRITRVSDAVEEGDLVPPPPA
jgi:hypothetical protein